MKVIQLDPKAIIDYWETIEGAIARALKTSVGESSTYDYLRWLMSPEEYQCWVVFDEEDTPVNISITRINYYAQHKSLHLVTTTGINGGKWETYKEAHHTLSLIHI